MVHWACAGTRDFCSVLAILELVYSSAKKIFLAVHYIYSFVPIAQQAGQAAVLDRLSLYMCFWMHQYFLGGTLHLALIGEGK